jgi:molybdopterin-guanine dinucleotide biosynthesis adapter protein
MEELLRKARKPYVLGLVASCSGSGKTTLIEKLIVCLRDKGYKIGALKHSERQVEMDRTGKDSFRFTAAGANQVVVTSDRTIGMFHILREKVELEQVLILFENVDIILIEGYKNSQYPKIEVHRQCMGIPPLYQGGDYTDIIAVASDEKLEIDCDVLDLNDAARIAAWIAERAENFFNSDQIKLLSAH